MPTYPRFDVVVRVKEEVKHSIGMVSRKGRSHRNVRTFSAEQIAASAMGTKYTSHLQTSILPPFPFVSRPDEVLLNKG